MPAENYIVCKNNMLSRKNLFFPVHVFNLDLLSSGNFSPATYMIDLILFKQKLNPLTH